MKDALGVIEIQGLATAILVADTMAKTATVDILGVERANGMGWITVKVVGDVGAVNAAIGAGKQISERHNHYITSKVIPRPADSIDCVFLQQSNHDDKSTEKKLEKKNSDLAQKKDEPSKTISKAGNYSKEDSKSALSKNAGKAAKKVVKESKPTSTKTVETPKPKAENEKVPSATKSAPKLEDKAGASSKSIAQTPVSTKSKAKSTAIVEGSETSKASTTNEQTKTAKQDMGKGEANNKKGTSEKE